jgi:adenine phosphoribosyltransferase
VDLKAFIRDIPDFPKPGILFRDITPLLAAPAAFRETVRRFVEHFRDRGIEAVVAAEARGFVFGAPLALDCAFVPVRKRGKLPYERHAHEYALEYGTDTLEIHVDGVAPGQRVLVIDDLLATGGTARACCSLMEKVGAKIDACAFMIELSALDGRRQLAPHDVFSLVTY